MYTNQIWTVEQEQIINNMHSLNLRFAGVMNSLVVKTLQQVMVG